MNAELACKELELAVYELAEAETAERRARQLRSQAARRISAFHAELKSAIITAQTKRTPCR